MKKIAIFASGNGSNAENIIRYFQMPGRDGRVELVVTNRRDAPVVGRAARLGVDCEIFDREQFRDGARVIELLERRGIDVVVLAGFLLMVAPPLIARYRGRIVNIHPSLLPKFGGKGMYGRHVHEAVVAAGEKVTGITIHHVNEHYDDGAVIFTASVAVEPTDSADDVARKVQELEQEHFAAVIDREFIAPSRQID